MPKMNFSDDVVKDWLVPNVTGVEGSLDEIQLGEVLSSPARVERWSLNTILAISLGPLGAVLVISYIVHWFQVAAKIRKNKKARRRFGETGEKQQGGSRDKGEGATRKEERRGKKSDEEGESLEIG